MVSRFICLIFIVKLVSASILFSSHNYDYKIHSSCYNSTSGTSDSDCYPFWYENSDGSTNAFANYVAFLNFVNPLITLLGMKGNQYFINFSDKKISDLIKNHLLDVEGSERELRIFLAKLIKQFDNGIGSEEDLSLLMGLIENLNIYKCAHCIDEFVTLVSKDFRNEDFKPVSLLDVLEEDKRETNKKDYIEFAQALPSRMGENKCNEYEKIAQIVPPAKGWIKKVRNAFLYNWINPMHWSSLSYTGAALIIPPAFSALVQTNNRAGAFIGDMANISNAVVIPTIHTYTFFQNLLNYNRVKNQRLTEAIQGRLQAIEGIIEIAGKVIGSMDNNINNIEAKGFLKVLILLGWPDAQVQNFMNLATNHNQAFAPFIASIKRQYNDRKIKYRDFDIDAAFAYDDSKLEFEVEIN